MKTALIFLSIAILFLLLFWWRTDIYFSDSTVDIHFHDTYYVIANLHVVLVVSLFLGTFFALGGTIGTKFHNKFFIIMLALFMAVDAYIIWEVYSMFNSIKS